MCKPAWNPPNAVFIITIAPSSPLAAWLFVPYAAWVAFATALDAALWRLNRDAQPTPAAPRT